MFLFLYKSCAESYILGRAFDFATDGEKFTGLLNPAGRENEQP